jgi:linoleoyl-CoA desaturase
MIGFNGGGAFSQELRALARRYASDRVRARQAQRRIYVKSAVIISWAVASWTLLVFVASGWWLGAALALSLGLALAGVGFNVTHDANHGSYSTRRWVNRSLRWSLDVIGASSYVWRVKHNIVHHTYTNISGADSDIEQLPFLRLAPDQRRRWFHRYQHIYAWPLYGLFAVKWQILGDVQQLWKGNIEGTPLPWPKGRELLGFWLGKAIFLTWAVGLPLLFQPAWQVAIAFLATSFVLAFTLAVTFQLAHCVEEAGFSSVEALAGAERTEWTRHQVEATVDFAPDNRLVAWFLGGLNFQIEHHLFSRVCHTNYAALAPLVKDVCDRHGVSYRAHRTVTQALMSHVRWLRRLGRPSPRQTAPSIAS